MSLNELFLKISYTTRLIEYNKDDEALIAILIKELKQFEKLLTKTDDIDLYEFVDEHKHLLSHIKTVIDSNCKKNPTLRSLSDKIFKNRLNFSRYVPSGITILFTEIIKGITYFESQIDNTKRVPIYHRLFSCGKGDGAFRNRFLQCTTDKSHENLKRVSKQIQRCYIERLIYDQLVQLEGVLESQDEGHIFFLKETKSDFHTCFPLNDITVNIEYSDNSIIPATETDIPTKIIISYFKNNKPEFTEIYKKSFTETRMGKQYEKIVECEKTTVNNDKFYKNQEFRHQTSWKRNK